MAERLNTAAELSALRATLEAKMRADERDRIEAKEQREGMATDIAAIRKDASKIDHRVTNIEADMAKVKPVINKVNSWQSMALGGMVVLGMMGAAVSLFWEAVRDKITAAFTGA
jgi:uncharacterized protein YPO0396